MAGHLSGRLYTFVEIECMLAIILHMDWQVYNVNYTIKCEWVGIGVDLDETGYS